MKKYLKFLGFVVFSLFLFSCSRGGDDTSSGYYFRAKINGVNFVGEEPYLKALVHTIGGSTSLNLVGIRNNKEKIDIVFAGYTAGATGNFPFEFQNANLTPILANYYKDLAAVNDITAYGGSKGVLTITENANGKIRGTFSFKAKNTANQEVTISEGQFHLPLTQP